MSPPATAPSATRPTMPSRRRPCPGGRGPRSARAGASPGRRGVTSSQGSGSTPAHAGAGCAPAAGSGPEETDGGGPYAGGGPYGDGERGTTGCDVAHAEDGAAGGEAVGTPVTPSTGRPSARAGGAPSAGRGLVSSFVLDRPSAPALGTHVVLAVGTL